MDKKPEHFSCGEEQATEGIQTSYSRITIDIVDLMEKIGILKEKIPESIQQIVMKYQSIKK